MDEFAKYSKFGTEQKINCNLGCDTCKNIRAIELKTVQKNINKYEQRVTCSESSIVVALCLLPAEKLNVKRNC
jgi:hypothetical protein